MAPSARSVLTVSTELGEYGTVTPAALRIAERGLRNLLVHAGILPESKRIAGDGPTRIFDVGGQDYYSYASEDRLFKASPTR